MSVERRSRQERRIAADRKAKVDAERIIAETIAAVRARSAKRSGDQGDQSA